MTKVLNLRERPSAGQIMSQAVVIALVYIAVAFTLTIAGIYIGSLITGQDQMEIMSSAGGEGADVSTATINALKVVQLFNMLGFLLAAILLSRMLFRADPIEYIGVRRNSTIPVYFLALLGFMALIPMLELSIALNLEMDLPGWMQPVEDWMRSTEDRTARLTENFLVMDSIRDLVINALLMAVLPAICEEIFFRGFLQRAIYGWWGRKHLAVILSAFIFSAIHMQFYGFLPRFLLGILLGYVFLWSGDLKVSMLLHFMNNFMSLLFAWVNRDNLHEIDISAPMVSYPAFFYVVSAAAGGGFLYLLYRQSKKRPAQETESDTIYRLPISEVPWEKVYSTGHQYEAEIVAGKLEDAGIKAVIVNKQDSSYRSFGEIEVHVPRTFVDRAKEILG